MRSKALLLMMIVALATVAVTTSRSYAQGGTVVDLAVTNGSLEMLTAAVTEAELAETLAGSGPFTVFAPTDAAFAKLPAGTVEALLEPSNRAALIRLLQHHVVPGKLTVTDALTRGPLTTLAGSQLAVTVESGQLRVHAAAVIANDLGATNGIVHVIDTVMIPPQLPSARRTPPVFALLALAIERGVPVFNDGDPAGCAATYEVACQAVLTLTDDLQENDRVILDFAVNEAREQSDPTRRAWILRRAMDRLLQGWVGDDAPLHLDAENGQAAAASKPAWVMQTVFSFDSGHADARWFSVNDDVMGGVSNGRFETEAGVGRFVGALSLDNNGGFATIRSPGRNLDLDGYDGLLLRVRGDGRRYGFSVLPTDRRYEVNTWRVDFDTVAGEWQEVRVPFSSLVRQVMGRRFPESAPLAASRIKSLAFSISDKNESPFLLEVDWIRAYKNGSSPQL